MSNQRSQYPKEKRKKVCGSEDDAQARLHVSTDTFRQSQDQRTKAFERVSQERHINFTSNEAKRRDEFLKTQRQRKKEFEEAEVARETSFLDTQQRCENDFRNTESNREETFRQSEIRRATYTKSVQKGRGLRFQSLQEELERKSVEGINKRLEELKAWGRRLVEYSEQERERLFTDERKVFEDAFRGLFGHRDLNLD